MVLLLHRQFSKESSWFLHCGYVSQHMRIAHCTFVWGARVGIGCINGKNIFDLWTDDVSVLSINLFLSYADICSSFKWHFYHSSFTNFFPGGYVFSSVCLSVYSIMQTVLKQFWWNLVGLSTSAVTTILSILDLIVSKNNQMPAILDFDYNIFVNSSKGIREKSHFR